VKDAVIATAKLLLFLVGLPLAAIAASSVVGGWIVAVILVGMLVYLMGAIASAWSFLGEDASMRP
jgi:hypothetical protein